MATNSTVSELRKAAEISDQEIDAAVDAYLASPQAAPFRFASGHEVDVAVAAKSYPPASVAMAEFDRTRMFRWTRVRTAILLAHPVKR